MTSASYASITGIAILESPHKTTAKGLAFDAHFYLGAELQESILVLLCYFNANDIEFPPVGVYSTYATVAKMDPDSAVDIFATEGSTHKRKSYALVGDVQFLHFLGLPDEVDVDTCCRPYVHIAGVAMDRKEPTATWFMEADQYTASIRDLQKAAKVNGSEPVPRSFFPAFCTIRDSRCYPNNKKPIPFNKRYVMVVGYLTNVKSQLDNDGKLKECFCIDIENVAFLGTQTTPATGGTVTDGHAFSSTSTPASNKRGWSFGAGNAKKGKMRRVTSPAPEGSSSPAPGPSSSPSPFVVPGLTQHE
ncbi:hypothetical protein C8R45DRAFT_1096213 [Mycena sanguinolenta]|nr:hypothetical protein C8R45DRAFT_1096213 [Mycena sanguinolenta]